MSKIVKKIKSCQKLPTKNCQNCQSCWLTKSCFLITLCMSKSKVGNSTNSVTKLPIQLFAGQIKARDVWWYAFLEFWANLWSCIWRISFSEKLSCWKITRFFVQPPILTKRLPALMIKIINQTRCELHSPSFSKWCVCFQNPQTWKSLEDQNYHWSTQQGSNTRVILEILLHLKRSWNPNLFL